MAEIFTLATASKLLALFKSRRAIVTLCFAGIKLARSAPDLIASLGDTEKLSAAKEKLLGDLFDLFSGLGGNLHANELQRILDDLPADALDQTNAHLVRFTGCVLEASLTTLVQSPEFPSLLMPHIRDYEQRELRIQEFKAALPQLSEQWTIYIGQQDPDHQPLAGQDFANTLNAILRGEPDIQIIPLVVLIDFLDHWFQTRVTPLTTHPGLTRALAEAISPSLGSALSTSIATDHPAARAALAKTLLRNQAAFSAQLTGIINTLKGIGIDVKDIATKVNALYDALIPPPIDPRSKLDAYARNVLEKLSPVPLTQILNQPDLPVVSVDRVYTPLQVREVDYQDIGKLLHAKELSDWHGRETEHDAPEELKQHQADLADFLRTSPPRDAIEVLDAGDFSPQIFLGEPGGGKTLFARHLVTGWAETWPSMRDDWQSQWISIYVELKHYAQLREDHTVTSVRDYLGSPHYPYGALPDIIFDEDGTDTMCLLIFDGLDEVLHGPTKSLIVEELLGLRNPYHHVIVTSRIADFDPHPWSRHPWCFIYRIDPLTPTEQRGFIQRYHEAFFPNQEERQFRIDRLQNKLRDFHRLAELAGTPLLLTLLCLVNRDPALPETRTELYEQAAELLLHNWDFFHFQQDDHQHRDHLAPLQKTEKHAIMRRLAWLLMMGKPGKHANDSGILCERQHLSANLFPTSIVADAVRDVLKELNKPNPENYVALLPKLLVERNSVLCPSTVGKHSFIHRTFLEFYAAWAWVEEEIPWNDPTVPWADNLWPAAMTPQQRYEHLFQPHWQDSIWRIILILHCGRLKPSYAEKLLRSLLTLADTQAAAAGTDHASENAMALQLESQAALLLAAEAFSETRERGRLPDLHRTLQQRLQTLATSAYTVSNTRVDQDRHNRDHRQAAVRLSVQLANDNTQIECWLHSLSTDMELSDYVRAASLRELASLSGLSQSYRQHLHALLLRPETSISYRNVLLLHFDSHWGQSGLDEALQGLAGLPALEELSLNSCKGLQSTQGLPKLTALKTLYLRDCIGLAGEGALLGLAGLDKLEYLSLSGCTGLRSTQGLPPLPSLKKLDLRFCTGLEGEEALLGLVGREELKEVWLRSCTRLTEEMVVQFRQRTGSRWMAIWV